MHARNVIIKHPGGYIHMQYLIHGLKKIYANSYCTITLSKNNKNTV